MQNEIVKILKNRLQNNSNIVVLEKEPEIEPTHNYTGHGWEGENYRKHKIYSTKEICQKIREELKKEFPKYKFSVSKHHYSSIIVCLMQADFNPFVESELTEYEKKDQHVSINQYYLKETEKLNQKAKEVMEKVYKIVNSWNYDDSDAMTDYFNTNFYLDLSIGKWDKPFIKK